MGMVKYDSALQHHERRGRLVNVRNVGEAKNIFSLACLRLLFLSYLMIRIK